MILLQLAQPLSPESSKEIGYSLTLSPSILLLLVVIIVFSHPFCVCSEQTSEQTVPNIQARMTFNFELKCAFQNGGLEFSQVLLRLQIGTPTALEGFLQISFSG